MGEHPAQPSQSLGDAEPVVPASARVRSLDELQLAGYVTDEWATWQQGRCGTYAVALIAANPHLRFGTLGESDPDGGWVPLHHFAHDDEYAYDSAGRHPLPYRGIEGTADVMLLDEQPDWYGVPQQEAGPEGSGPHLLAAHAHAVRHSIVQ